MNIVELLNVYKWDNKIRLGAYYDGGYVIAKLEGGYDCYISAGVSNEESFSRDFIIEYNMDKYNSFAFDGTIYKYPYQYTNDITFVRKNINIINDDDNTNLKLLIEKYNNIFLKMDIEGWEWKWLLSLDDKHLYKMKQIVIELHGIGIDNNEWNAHYNEKLGVLSRLSRTHYIVHNHPNNYAPVINNTPTVIELTLINKNYVYKQLGLTSELELEPYTYSLTPYDFPNNKNAKDIDVKLKTKIVGLKWQQSYMGLKYHMEDALEEKNQDKSIATNCPPYALFSHKYFNELNSLNKEKIYDYCFIGSINSCYEKRKWVIEFAKKHFTSNSIFVNTDKNPKWKLLGEFDYSHNSFGYCPKEQKDNQSRECQYRVIQDNLYYFTNMCQSKFTLCPSGDAPWSFRFYETLMCSSIPIVDSYHHTYRTLEESEIDYKYVDKDINNISDNLYNQYIEKNTELFKKYHLLE